MGTSVLCMLSCGDKCAVHVIMTFGWLVPHEISDNVISISVWGSHFYGDCILFMWHLDSILLKKSGVSLPRVELEEMGPSLDLEVRRSRVGSATDFKKACKQPKASKVRTYVTSE